MSKEKTHEVKESRIKELAEICPEFKNAMHILFPEALEKESSNVTEELDVFLKHSSDGTACIKLGHEGEEIALIKKYAIKIEHADYYMKDTAMKYYFKIIKGGKE